MTSGDGHVAINLRKALDLGIGGHLKLVEEAMAALNPADYGDLKKRQLYLAMIDALEGTSSYIRRYAELAASMAEVEQDPTRRPELQTIASTCASLVSHARNNFV